MRVPHEFTIDGIGWRLRYGREDERDDYDPSKHHGTCSYEKKLIILHPELRSNRRKQAEALVHELLHAVSDHHDAAKTAGWKPLHHALITRLAPVLADLMLENDWSFTSPLPCKQCAKRAQKEKADIGS